MPDLVRMERGVRVPSIPSLESPSLRSTQTPTIVVVPIHKATPTSRTARPAHTVVPAHTLPPTRTISIVTVNAPGRAIPTFPTSSRRNTLISHTALTFTRGSATPIASQPLATTLSAFGRVSEQISQPSTTPPTQTAHHDVDPHVVFGVVVAALVAGVFIIFWVLWRFCGVLRRRTGIRRRQGQPRPSISPHIRPYGSRAARVPPSVGRVEHALEKLRGLGHSSKEVQSIEPVPSHGDGATARDVERGEPNGSNDTSIQLGTEIREFAHGDGHETGSAILLELEDAVRDAGLSVDVLLASLRRVNQRVEGAESEVGSALPPIYMHSEPGEVQ